MRYRLLLQTSRALQDPPSSAPPAVDSRCVSHGSPAGPPALGPTLPSLLQRSQAKGPRPWPGALLLPTGPQRAPRAPSPPHHSSQRPSLTLPTPLSSDRCHFTSLCICLSVSPTRTKPSVGFVLFLLQPQCPEWGQACRRGGGGTWFQLALGFAAIIVHVSSLPGDSWRPGSYFLVSLVLSN